MGVLEMTIPEKPNDRNQKEEKVEEYQYNDLWNEVFTEQKSKKDYLKKMRLK